MTVLAALPGKLDQPDHPIGMGKAFIILLIIVGIIGIIFLMIGAMRPKRREGDAIRFPVLLKDEDKVGYRPTSGGRPTRPKS